jgi:23S rRNA pseudouridine1911/1915/1917 synthase
MNIIELIVDESAAGIRIEKWLAENKELDITRNRADTLVRRGDVSINGKQIIKTYKLKCGDIVSINMPEPVELNVTAENIPLDIVYEDNDLIVVNKSKGMVVHPAPGNYSGTLVNALLFHCKGNLSAINGVIRPGIVHRIDKNTSGLLIVAKNDIAHTGLAEQIKNHSFTREYEAIVCGHFKENRGTVNAPIGRSSADRKKMCVTEKNSKSAVTHYEVLADYKNYSHIKCILETGRTHQIRVHMAYIGHPVLGDDVYGKPFKDIEGQCLHARKIGFVHPITGEYLEFTSELPEYFMNVIEKIRK